MRTHNTSHILIVMWILTIVTLLSFYDSRDQDQMLLHHKIVFLKKVQLSFKASLSRTDSLIHKYEESIDPKTERTSFNDNHHEADMEWLC
jgi:hypothetical protein